MFRRGEQPCSDFEAQRDEYYDLDNLHDCYAKGCKGKVSLCKNCFRDHHSDGYETCTKIWKHHLPLSHSLRKALKEAQQREEMRKEA